MKLNKNQVEEFEKNKAGLEAKMRQGFSFPSRSGFFAQFRKLENEIGSLSMDDTEKAAYLSFCHCSHCEGENPDHNWTLSAKTTEAGTQEFEHFKACQLALERFTFNSVIDSLEPDADRGRKFKRTPDALRVEAKAKAIARKDELIRQDYSPVKANGVVQAEFEKMQEYKELFEDFGTGDWKKFLQK